MWELRVGENWEGGEMVKGKGLVKRVGLLRGVDIGECMVDEGVDGVGYVDGF